MTDKNILTKLSLSLKYVDSDSEYLSYCTKEVLKHLTVYDKIYSYAATSRWTANNEFCELYVTYLISQNDRYNTIDSLAAASDIIHCIAEGMYYQPNTKTNLVCYGQPALDLLCEIYEPLVRSISAQAYSKWKRYLELEDVQQTAWLILITLYNQHYLIHERLIKRVFHAEILKQVRPSKRLGNDISLSIELNDENNDTITLEDALPDVKASDDFDNLFYGTREEQDIAHKALVMGLISQRTYEQLIFSFEHNSANQWASDQVHYLKKKISKRSNNNGDN